MPASRTTCWNLATSARNLPLNSSGADATGSLPIALRRASACAGSAMTRAGFARNRSTISRGRAGGHEIALPAGASKPGWRLRRRSARPVSTAERLALLTASARSWPPSDERNNGTDRHRSRHRSRPRSARIEQRIAAIGNRLDVDAGRALEHFHVRCS